MENYRGNVWITGASSGIGWATAIHMARSGWRVAASARNSSALKALVEKDSSISAYPLDVTDAEARVSVYKRIRKEIGPVDILINNAGYGIRGTIEDVPVHEVRNMFDVNFFSVLELTKLVLPDMRSYKSGRIINVSSVLGRESFPVNGHYSSTKFAMESISDALRVEVMPWNIKVVLVEPGPIKTNFPDAAKSSSLDRLNNEKSPYFAVYQNFLSDGYFQGTKRWGAASVAEVIRHACETETPKARYPVHPQAVILPILGKILPTALRDKLVGSRLGLTDPINLPEHPDLENEE